MTEPKDKSGDEAPIEIEIEMTLEPPPVTEALAVGASAPSLFGDETALLAAAKLSIAEGFLVQITREQSFSDFLRETLLTIMRVVKCEAGSLLEVDHARRALFFRSVVGASSDRVASFVIPMGQGIVGHVAESRRPLVVANVAENKIHLKSIQDAVGFTAKNLVALPIVIRGRIYGVLELLNRIGESDFSTSDVELLTYACDMASKAIEARLMIAWATRRRGGPASSQGEVA